MIRKAEDSDLAGVVAGYLERMEYELIHGAFTLWKIGVYPTLDTAREAFQAGTLYLLEEDGAICASMILNETQSPEYADVPWKYPAALGEVLVLHTLCVPPSKSGRGYGKKITQFAVQEAGRLGYRVMRLDTGTRNKPAMAIYTGAGFEISKSIPIPPREGRPADEHCFMECKI